MRVKVYGSSDDLIEVEGDIREEFGAYDQAKLLIFNDGTQVKVQYSPEGYDGKWRVEPKVKPEGVMMAHIPAKNDDDDYSDVLEIEGPFTSVECWKAYPPHQKELVEAFEQIEMRDLNADQLMRMYKIAKE